MYVMYIWGTESNGGKFSNLPPLLFYTKPTGLMTAAQRTHPHVPCRRSDRIGTGNRLLVDISSQGWHIRRARSLPRWH
jgi:hypothetical protein